MSIAESFAKGGSEMVQDVSERTTKAIESATPKTNQLHPSEGNQPDQDVAIPEQADVETQRQELEEEPKDLFEDTFGPDTTNDNGVEPAKIQKSGNATSQVTMSPNALKRKRSEPFCIISESLPTIVKAADGRSWVELRCYLCHGNYISRQKRFLNGAGGFMSHLHTTHSDKFIRGDGRAGTVQKCTVRHLTSEEADGVIRGIPGAYEVAKIPLYIPESSR